MLVAVRVGCTGSAFGRLRQLAGAVRQLSSVIFFETRLFVASATWFQHLCLSLQHVTHRMCWAC